MSALVGFLLQSVLQDVIKRGTDGMLTASERKRLFKHVTGQVRPKGFRVPKAAFDAWLDTDSDWDRVLAPRRGDPEVLVQTLVEQIYRHDAKLSRTEGREHVRERAHLIVMATLTGFIESLDPARAAAAGTATVLTRLEEEVGTVLSGLERLGGGPMTTGRPRLRVRSVEPLNGSEVDRPELIARLRTAVTGDTGIIGVTGPGGFGKTTLARQLVADPVVREQFPDIVWTTIGEDASTEDVAGRLNELTYQFSGFRPPTADPRAAAADLAHACRGRRVLLVADDVWTRQQIAPFIALVRPEDDPVPVLPQDVPVTAPPEFRLLVTTRQRDLLPTGGHEVLVDKMTEEEARQLVTAGLTKLSTGSADRLLRVTGRWPVLLALVNGAISADVALGAKADDAVASLADDLTRSGPALLDVTDRDDRARAVAQVMAAGLDRLNPVEQERYRDLAIFAEDAEIPLPVLQRLWEHRSGWSGTTTRWFCERLYQGSLLADRRLDRGGTVRMHDVVRTWLRHDERTDLRSAHAALVAAHRDLLPLPEEAGPVAAYLWEWLPTHLAESGDGPAVSGLVLDPHWLTGKLTVAGPTGLAKDLRLTDEVPARLLERLLRQDGQILVPMESPGALAATLAFRMGDHRLDALRRDLLEYAGTPRLEHVGAPPDLPPPTLHRVLSGSFHPEGSPMVAPDGSWLAIVGRDRQVHLVEPLTGTEIHRLEGILAGPGSLVVAPDGSWLAAATADGTIWIWDPATGRHLRTLSCPTVLTQAVTTTSDGSLLVTAGRNRTVRTWDPASGTQLATIPPPRGTGVRRQLISPDGSWLLTADSGGPARTDPATTLPGTDAPEPSPTSSNTLSLNETDAPEPSRASSNTPPIDGTGAPEPPRTSSSTLPLYARPTTSGTRPAPDLIRIWNPLTGNLIRELTVPGAGRVRALRPGPDGSWVALAYEDGRVVIWDPIADRALYSRTATTGGDLRPTRLLSSRGSTWAASLDGLGTVRIWNSAHPGKGHTLIGRVDAMTANLDGSLLATVSGDGTVRLWHPESAAEVRPAVLTGNIGRTHRLMTAPDGSWLATMDTGGTVRVWGSGLNEDPLERPTVVTPSSGPSRFTRLNRTVRQAGPATPLGDLRYRRLEVLGPDGTWVAAAQGRVVHILRHGTGEVIHTLAGHVGPIEAVAVAPDGTWIASASSDRTVRLWDTASGGLRRTLVATHSLTLIALVVAADGSWLATSSDDGVYVWDPSDGRRIGTFTVHAAGSDAIAVAPDSTWIAVAGLDGGVRVWDPAHGSRRLGRQNLRARALAVAENGSWLAVVSDDALRVFGCGGSWELLAAVRTSVPASSVQAVGDHTIIGYGKAGRFEWRLVTAKDF